MFKVLRIQKSSGSSSQAFSRCRNDSQIDPPRNIHLILMMKPHNTHDL